VTLARLWPFTAVSLAALAGLVAPVSTVDLAYAIRTGQVIIETGSVPTTDSFTFTAQGAPWFDQQWLAQLVFAGAFAAAGWEGLVVLRALLVALAVGVVLAACRLRGANPRAAALLALGALLVASPALALRAQLLGVVAFAVTLALVAGRHRHPLVPWGVPVMAAVWANVHGSFVLAPAVVGWAILEDGLDGRPWRRWLPVLVVTVLATFVTPFGPTVWAYTIALSSNPLIRRLITEWQPTWPLTAVGVAFYASAALAVLAILTRRARADWNPATVAWLAILALLGAVAQRNVVWWAFGATVALAPVVPRATLPAGRPALGGAVAAGLVLAVTVALPWWRTWAGGPDALLVDAPSGIATTLRELGAQRVFAPQRWSSWFELTVPNARYAVDSRVELFDEQTWRQYAAVRDAGPGWERILDAWDVGAVVAAAADGPGQVDALIAADWRVAYADDQGVILLRRVLAAE